MYTLGTRRKRMDLSVSVPPPSCSEALGPGPQKTKTLCVLEKNGPWASHPLEIHTQNAVNEHFADVM